jgi:hypothetical protein
LNIDIAMLARRVAVALVLQRLERADEARARVARHQDFIDVPELGRLERVGEGAPVFLGEPVALGDRVARPGKLVAEHDVDGLLGAHHRDLRGRIGEVEVAANVLR